MRNAYERYKISIYTTYFFLLRNNIDTLLEFQNVFFICQLTIS